MTPLEERRTELCLSQLELADESEVSQSMISRLERIADLKPKMGIALMLADTLLIDVEKLFPNGIDRECYKWDE